MLNISHRAFNSPQMLIFACVGFLVFAKIWFGEDLTILTWKSMSGSLIENTLKYSDKSAGNVVSR